MITSEAIRGSLSSSSSTAPFCAGAEGFGVATRVAASIGALASFAVEYSASMVMVATKQAVGEEVRFLVIAVRSKRLDGSNIKKPRRLQHVRNCERALATVTG